jgi:acyl-CoA synthetase (AMP-forming)/AMP-acid ligase II/3-hydroxymyristoyl/3-hydroxydecanoyl-(acyl carrier protein) dehydratase
MTSTITAIGTSGRDDDAPLCYDAGAIRTWREWRGDVDRLAGALAARKETRWGLYASNTYAFSVGLFGLWLSAKKPVIPPLNTAAMAQSLAPHVDGLLGEFPFAEPIIRVEDADDTQEDRRIDPDSELLMFTSGSSGQPKAIPKRLHQLDAEVATLERHWGSQTADRVTFATVSHQHIYGLLFKVLWPLAAKRPFYANIVRDPNTMVKLAAQHRRTVCVTSPAFLKRIPAATLESFQTERHIVLFSSGGLLATPVAHRIARHLAPVIEVYGSTETGGIAHREQSPSDIDTPWTLLDVVRVRADGNGRLLARSPHLPDDAWHATGDRGEIIDDRTFHLGSRVDRIVKVEEKRVSLAAMEAALRAIAGIKESACVVHPGRRDIVCVVVALDEMGYRQLYGDGRRRYITRLRAALAAQFDPLTLPRKWRFVEELPTNDQGKSSAAVLLAQFDPPRVPRLPTVTGIDCASPTDAVLTLFVPRQLAYFDGHFPGTPVLPGVAQLFWVGHFARQLFGVDAAWRQMEAVKFNRLVTPETKVTLHLQLREDRQRLQFSYAVDGITCSSGRLIQRE